MGGFGSGRHGGKPLVDSALQIDFGWLIREGRAVTGQISSGKLSWTCDGEPNGNIGFICDMRDDDRAVLILRFKVQNRRSGESQHYEQQIRLSYTRPHYGGKRWWMHCPFTGERVGKLYCPDGAHEFASRKAYKLAYRSQRLSPRDKPFEAMFKLQKHLGCEQGWQNYIRRPKGMWHRTFAKYMERYYALDQQCYSIAEEVSANLSKSGDDIGLACRL